MADKKTKTSSPLGYAVQETFPARKALEVDDQILERRKLNEIGQLVMLPPDIDEGERNARLIRALELYESLTPADGLEGMLTAQMVGTHHAALECLRRAAIPEQTLEAKDMNLKHAQKLMALYTQQVAALNKHRGKGQQKVTVEHVTVQSGGQAIVGNVEPGAGGTSRKGDQIEAQSSLQDAPIPEKRAKAPKRR